MVLGLAGLLIGRLGETTWAPETERTATVDLSDPGPAVVIDPGVLYVGGTQGDVKITGDSDVSVITASNDDIDAYLDGVKHTQVTGLSDWSTLKTETVDGDGKDSISDPTSSDLWRSVQTSKSPATIDVSDFYTEETSTDPQPYRAILLVTDGTEPGADSISITWPVDEKNEWVPFAYAAGATLIIVGLVMLVVSFGSSRRERERVGAEEGGAAGVAGTSAAGGDDEEPSAAQERTEPRTPAHDETESAEAAHDGPADDETAHDGAAHDGSADNEHASAQDALDEPTREENASAQAGSEISSAAAVGVLGGAAGASAAAAGDEPPTDRLDRIEDEPAATSASAAGVPEHDDEAAPVGQSPVAAADQDAAADEGVAVDQDIAADQDAAAQDDAPDAVEVDAESAAAEDAHLSDAPEGEAAAPASEPETMQLSAEDEPRPRTAPIPVGGSDGTGTGHEDAEGSEDPTEVIARIEEPIAGTGEDQEAALPRRSRSHRAVTPAPQSDEITDEDAQHDDPENGSGTEEEQR